MRYTESRQWPGPNRELFHLGTAPVEEFENRACLIYGGKTYDYGHLLDRVREWQDTLVDLDKRYGLAPGDPVTLVGDYAPETIFLILALLLNGHIVIPITPEADQEKFTAIAAPRVVSGWIPGAIGTIPQKKKVQQNQSSISNSML